MWVLIVGCMQILAVQEKSGVFQGAGIWKMPTGSVNQVRSYSAKFSFLHVQMELGIRNAGTLHLERQHHLHLL
jgi:hypothetical protein